MPFIQNIAMMDVSEGYYPNPGENSMLIQIMNIDTENFPIAKTTFKEIHQFKFLDLEDNFPDSTWKISDAQAAELVRLLQKALAEDMNVIVHCHAGVCRSGAVCEVGVMMGFEDKERYRAPNLLVKSKMMKVLGWTYE